MAIVNALSALNTDQWNLHPLQGGQVEFLDNAGIVSDAGIRYEDVVLVAYGSGPLLAALAGSGIAVDESGAMTAGTVRGLFFGGVVGGQGYDTWLFDNLAPLRATDVQSALASSSRTDDMALLQQALSGSDQASLSDQGDVFRSYAGNDQVSGRAGNDLLDGGSGDDQLDGGTGNDSLLGGDGNDRLDGGTGSDSLSGATGNDRLVGLDADTLTGGIGNDTLDADGDQPPSTPQPGALLIGGAGNDVYYIDSTADRIVETTTVGGTLDAGGIDTVHSRVSCTLSRYVENLTLANDAAMSNVYRIDATGNDLDNVIRGNWSYNVIDGGKGADTMYGGSGPYGDNGDTFIVDNVLDQVIITGESDGDVIRSSITYRLPAAAEELELTGTRAIDGTGNASANRLTGNSGANVLDGGTGADWMAGGAGNDTYVVDNPGDQVYESGGGIDTVRAGISWELAGVERLELTGTRAINGTGDGLGNLLVGNVAANRLDGSFGADTMNGGLGGDTYVVDQAGDVIVETSTAATEIDTVLSSVTRGLGPNLENLTLVGSVAINGSGNTLANRITGNGADNQLSGGAGNDTLVGNGGADWLYGGSGDDSLVGAAGDTLVGGAGNDRLVGGSGAVVFRFGAALDADLNVDRITGFQSGDDRIELAVSVFTSIGGRGALDADAFVVGTVAADAQDRIVYDESTGRLYYDADGNGGAAATLFATLAPFIALESSDFWGV